MAAKIPPHQPLKVLDLGCGNGRFGLFLAQNLSPKIHYTGLDNNAYLLERAAETLSAANIPHELAEADLLELSLPPAAYDLIVLFGVLHHIPAETNRRALIEKAAQALKPHALLIVTAWLFYEVPRLHKRVIPWDSPILPADYQNLDLLDLEANDYLLDWQREVATPALRYCHYVEAAERERLFSGLEQIADFQADQANHYSLFSKA